MVVNNKFIFLELTKAASSHLANLLVKHTDSKRIGKHNRIEDFNSLNGSVKILGCIRNPWDWYVSLWAAGCESREYLMRCATNKEPIKAIKDYKNSPSLMLYSVYNQLTKPTLLWKELYSDPYSKKNFNRWIKTVFNEKRCFDYRELYAKSSISSFAGILTYRYVRLYCDKLKTLYGNEIDSIKKLASFDSLNNQLDFTIKVENISSDLLAALKLCDVKLPNNGIEELYQSSKTNSSKHLETREYYTDETIDLIYKREKLIVDKYNYSFNGF